MTDEQIGWFLDSARESLEGSTMVLDEDEITVTPELEAAIDAYESDLYAVLVEFAESGLDEPLPPEEAEAFADELMQAPLRYVRRKGGDAPANVLLTLQGHGVGIWDGRWEDFMSESELDRLEKLLKERLSRHAEETGTGALNDALTNAVLPPEPEYPEEPGGGYGSCPRCGQPLEESRYGLVCPACEEGALGRALTRPLRPVHENPEVCESCGAPLEDWGAYGVVCPYCEQEAQDRGESELTAETTRLGVARRPPRHGRWPLGQSQRELLPGGRASGTSRRDYDPHDLELGIKVELEHIDPSHPQAEELAAEVAMDHLAEDPNYYQELVRAGL